MEKIIVPKDKCPIMELTKMSAKLKNAWVFLHQDLITELYREAFFWGRDESYQDFAMHQNDVYPAREIRLNRDLVDKWSLCKDIKLGCTTIVYERPLYSIPERIIFVEVEK